MTLLFGVFTATGVLIVLLAIPLAQRRIAPNQLYGLRVRATFADREVWYDANQRSGRDLIYFGAGQVVLAAVLLLAGVSENTYAFGNVAYSLVGAITCGIVGWRRANAMLRARTGSAGQDNGTATDDGDSDRFGPRY